MKSYTFSEYKQMIENENISKYIIVEKFLNSLSKVEYKKIIIISGTSICGSCCKSSKWFS